MFTADKIDEQGVWLGDINASENIEALDNYKISHILTILDYEPNRTDNNRIRLYIAADDFQSTDLLTNEFEKCFNFINEAIEHGHQILIHCHAGISRSATIAAMYLMRKYSLTCEQALDILRCKRRYCAVMPNDGFLQQLDLFYKMNYKIDTNNQLYKEFQNKRLDSIQTATDYTQVFVFENENDKDYKCKSCNYKLFASKDIQKHEQKSKTLCNNQTQMFTYFLDWIDEIFTNPIGKINCPNCKIILGEYSLEGISCQCSQWIKPAFVFQCQLIK